MIGLLPVDCCNKKANNVMITEKPFLLPIATQPVNSRWEWN
jgi:hypothetical protein